MQTMDAALVQLVRRGVITEAEAEKRSNNTDELRRLAGTKVSVAGSGRDGRSSGYDPIRR